MSKRTTIQDDYRTRLSQKRLRAVVDYDSDTGVLTIKSDEAVINGSGNNIRIDGSCHAIVRLVILYVEGELPEENIRAIDGDRTNLKYSNLRKSGGYSGSPEHNQSSRMKPKPSKRKTNTSRPSRRYTHDEEIILAAAKLILREVK